MKRHVPAICTLIVAGLAATQAQTLGTIDRIAGAQRMRFGFSTDARPFSYWESSGGPAGYSVGLCLHIADVIRSELKSSTLPIEWVPVSPSTRFAAVRQHTIDLLCGADTVTIERRRSVDFSIPIFPGGISALVRTDAPARLKNVLSGHGQTFHPLWRASASEVLQFRAFSAVSSTTAEKWLHDRINDLKVVTTIAPVPTYDAGLDAVVNRRSDALFGERAILLDLVKRTGRKDVVVLDRLFTYEPLALALASDDDAFRLIVDRSLAQFYTYTPFGGFYARWFGEPDETTTTFFRWSAIPE